MTETEIRALVARECRYTSEGHVTDCVALVRAAEALVREECAVIAEDSDHRVEGRGYYDQLGDARVTQSNIAKAIRA